jgi:putative ATP-dependent endonuclease of OLD family
LTETTQCFVTSHSPYIIERFEPESIVRLSRDEAGLLTAVPVNLPGNMKVKTYRAQLRRAIAEAMLGQGAIIGEGATEQFALAAAAKKMEEADSELFPLDLAGITIVNTEGDGNLGAMGKFFKALGIPSFAFYDQKNRTTEEKANIEADFTIAQEIPYKGFELLIAEETPLDRQWAFLQAVRGEDSEVRYKIPSVRPADDALKVLTVAILKALKGEGGAAQLIELCSIAELPSTVVDFLKAVYANFPRPKKRSPTDESVKTPEPEPEIVAPASTPGPGDASSADAAGDSALPANTV